MKLDQVAAQLYTVRELCRTPAETAATLKKIAAIGYRSIQIAGIGPFDAAAMKGMARDAGLRICSFHDGIATLLDEPARACERAAILECDYVVSSVPTGYDVASEADMRRLVAKLSTAGPFYRAAGRTLCYHHHSLEFHRLGDRTVLDFIIENVDPAVLSVELDTYWIQHGGGNPAAWCRRLKNRLPIIHMKDFASVQGTPTMAEVGNGNLDWREIIAAADSSGCRWFVVEQDICPGDPLESLRLSYDYLRRSQL